MKQYYGIRQSGALVSVAGVRVYFEVIGSYGEFEVELETS